jgi:outer membrane protein assembly factor BamB
MSGDESEFDQSNQVSSGLNGIWLLRMAAAWAFTAFALPYLWARSFIGWQMTGRPESRFALALMIVLAGIVALTFHRGAMLARRRLVVPILVAVACTWIVVNVGMFYFRIGTLIPRSIVIASYLPGSLLVPWTGWMFFDSWAWSKRLSVWFSLVLLLFLFVGVFRVEGLSGASNVNFSWRRHKPDAAVMGPSSSSAASAALAESLGELISNPSRDFPQFLGPTRTGARDDVQLDRDWTNNLPRQLWRRSVGLGWSAFAVVGDFAFTQEQRGDQECVVCYRLMTGEEVWVHADRVNFASSLGGPGPRATPTVDGERVYSVGATGIFNCLNAITGEPLWAVNILEQEDAENISHGVCSSPLVHHETVLVCPTGGNGPSLVAYDRMTGDRLWGGGRHGASYSSPVVAKLVGVEQVLLCNSDGLTAHHIDSGEPLWHFAWTNSVRTNVAQPVVHAGQDDQVFISTGYEKGCALVRISRSEGGDWSVEQLWSNNRLKTKFCTAVLHNEHVFGLDDGILACLDLKSGNRTWKAGRYGHGQILRAGDLLIVQAEDGDVVLGELDPRQWRELGRIKALSAKTWNNPALAGSFLLVRNDREAACFELPLVQPSSGIGSDQ